MRTPCVLLSMIIGGISGMIMLFSTALTTMILLGAANSLAMSIVHVIINFGVAILSLVVVCRGTYRYLSMKLV